jgi:hypothetical protein
MDVSSFEQFQPDGAADASLNLVDRGVEDLAERTKPVALAHDVCIFPADDGREFTE